MPVFQRKRVETDAIQILVQENAVKDSGRLGEGEEHWFSKKKHDHQLARSLLLLTSLKNNIDARKRFAWAIYYLVCVWLTSVLGIVVFAGKKNGLTLSSSVLIALIGSGSVNVVGLFSIVAHYLFRVHTPEEAKHLHNTNVDQDSNEVEGTQENKSAETKTEEKKSESKSSPESSEAEDSPSTAEG